MRRADKEILDQQKVKQILLEAKVCHLSLHDQPYPYLLTVNFGYLGNSLYFHAATEGRKLDLIRNNPRVCFHVVTGLKMTTGTDPCADWTMKYRSVTGFGTAHILSGREEKTTGLNILMSHYTTKGPFEFTTERLDETAVVRIDIESMTAKSS